MNYTATLGSNAGKDFASLPLFQGVEPEVLRELLASAHTVQHQKGTVFLAQSAPISRFYVVLEGWCGASKGNAEGQEAILQLFRRGDFLLEAAPTAMPETSPVNLQALTPIQLLSLAPAALRTAMERSPVLTSSMLAVSSRRCEALRSHIEQLVLLNAENRVGRFLLQMRFSTSPEGTDIVLPFDKALIASYLGIKPETLSRAFQALRERGFVIERSHLSVPFRQALCQYCDLLTMQSCPFARERDCSQALKVEAARKGGGL